MRKAHIVFCREWVSPFGTKTGFRIGPVHTNLKRAQAELKYRNSEATFCRNSWELVSILRSEIEEFIETKGASHVETL